MSEDERLAQRFEADRSHLRAVAYRMLGSVNEADDAVQEAWLRLSRADISDVDNLRGWLTTVVARVCLDMLRSRTARREESLDGRGSELALHKPDDSDPEHEALQADSVGIALLVVLETLTPAERLAFVLHDLFGVPFEEIGPLVGRSGTAARQLASRARRRVRGARSVAATSASSRSGLSGDGARQRSIVSAFLAASRGGDFNALLALLDPDVVLRADGAAVQAGAAAEVRGAAAVAETFSGRARAARLALVDGAAGAIWAHGGHPRMVFSFVVDRSAIVEIAIVADPAQLAELEWEYLEG